MTAKRLGLSDFPLERAVLEIRYPTAYPLWDRAGQVGSKVTSNWRDTKLITGEPGRIGFRHKKKFDFVTELEQSRVIEYEPDKSNLELPNAAKKFFSIVCEELGVHEFSRIGFRQIHFLEFDTVEKASTSLIQNNLLRFPKGRIFESESDSVILPEVHARWVGKAHSVSVRIRVEERRIDITPPIGFNIEKAGEFKKEVVETVGISLDIDYFASATIERSQIDFGEWISHAGHILRRDIPKLLEPDIN